MDKRQPLKLISISLFFPKIGILRQGLIELMELKLLTSESLYMD